MNIVTHNKISLAALAIIISIAFIGIGWILGKNQEPAFNDEPEQTITQPKNILRENKQPEISEEEFIPVDTPTELPALSSTFVPAPSSLEASDAVVLLAIADLSPELAQWLIPAEQIRKWVMAVDLMADGNLPKRYRPIDYPMDKFEVNKDGFNTRISDKNYPRMNALIKASTVITPGKLANYYHQWSPLLEKAYAELGKKGSFDQRFQQMITQILANEPLINDALLTRPSVLYRYSDERFEKSSDVDKLLWRMGPENATIIQSFMRELRFYIETKTS